MMFDPWFAAALVVGYVFGSIPFGLLLTKLAGLGDIRAIGSGNIGATNVLRTGRKDLALATLILDSGKAGFVCLLFTYFANPTAGLIAGGAAFFWHVEGWDYEEALYFCVVVCSAARACWRLFPPAK